MLKFGLGYDFRRAPGDEREMREVYAAGLDAIAYAEELGFDYVYLSEHHFVDDGYLPSVAPLACAIAARTKKIRIGSYVLLLPFHNPLRLAEDFAVADLVSNGRIEVGVGAGYRKAEYDGFGLDRAERGSRMDEGCEVMLKAWTEDGWSFAGRHWTFNDVTLHPKPAQRPHPPLWISARAPAPARRAARFKAPLQLPPMPDIGVAAERTTYQAWADGLAAQGETPADYPVMGMFGAVVTDDLARAAAETSAAVRWRRELYAAWFTEAMDLPFDAEKLNKPSAEVRSLSGAAGDPETVIRGIETYVGRGIPYTHLATGGLHFELDRKGRNAYMENFARYVMPHFRGG
jgi:alkanesulfonate monooxygenase SsuD/methylene tetrahydromethanopterin reductase-like flavin-dependent oxidoreductase (luciferase family)